MCRLKALNVSPVNVTSILQCVLILHRLAEISLRAIPLEGDPLAVRNHSRNARLLYSLRNFTRARMPRSFSWESYAFDRTELRNSELHSNASSRQCRTDVTSLVLDFSVWSSQEALHVLIAL